MATGRVPTTANSPLTTKADSYESMPKAEYDRRLAAQVEHLTEIPTPDEA